MVTYMNTNRNTAKMKINTIIIKEEEEEENIHTKKKNKKGNTLPLLWELI